MCESGIVPGAAVALVLLSFGCGRAIADSLDYEDDGGLCLLQNNLSIFTGLPEGNGSRDTRRLMSLSKTSSYRAMLNQIFCAENDQPYDLPAETIGYDIGVGATTSNMDGSSTTSKSSRGVFAEMAFENGFSFVSKVTVSAGFKHSKEDISEVSSQTMSEKTSSSNVEFNIPEIKAGATFCVYQIELPFKDKTSLFFPNLIIKDQKIAMLSSSVTLEGTEHKFNEEALYNFRPSMWSHWFAYMSSSEGGNLRGWGSHPGPQGQWRMKRRHDGTYLLSPKKWLNWYAYMSHWGMNVRGWGSDPGSQGHFIIEPMDGHSQCWKISTNRWPNRLVMMESNGIGNLRGTDSHPGGAGCWIIECYRIYGGC